jgi:hypothetical protein
MASSQVEIASFNLSQNQKTQKTTWVSRVAKNNNNNLGNLNFNKKFHNVFGEKDDSSLSALVSPRHSKIVDRWAARQAQEVVSNLGKNNNQDAVKVFDKFPSRSSSFNSRRGREDSVSPPCSDGSSDSEKASSLGASSLVQIWEKRLNQSNCTKQNVPIAGRTNSDSSCNDTNACYLDDHGRVSEEEESSDESLIGCEYDKTRVTTNQNCLPKVKCNSDAVENEKSKVADIIKRLYVDNDQELSNSATNSPYRERDCVSTPKQLTEHKSFCQVTSHPRIRGRQAFNDLIMQFECDRHGELNNLAERGAVSKFTQRGRIQVKFASLFP